MRIICEDLGEIELKHPLTCVGPNEFALAEADARRIYRRLRTKKVLDYVDIWQFNNIMCSRGTVGANLVGYDFLASEGYPYWMIIVYLDIPEGVEWRRGISIEESMCFDVLDGLSVVRIDYPNRSYVTVSRNAGDFLECEVLRTEGNRVYLETESLVFAEGTVSTRACLTADEDGYLMTHYLEYANGIIYEHQERIKSKLIQPVVLQGGK